MICDLAVYLLLYMCISPGLCSIPFLCLFEYRSLRPYTISFLATGDFFSFVFNIFTPLFLYYLESGIRVMFLPFTLGYHNIYPYPWVFVLFPSFYSSNESIHKYIQVKPIYPRSLLYILCADIIDIPGYIAFKTCQGTRNRPRKEDRRSAGSPS